MRLFHWESYKEGFVGVFPVTTEAKTTILTFFSCHYACKINVHSCRLKLQRIQTSSEVETKEAVSWTSQTLHCLFPWCRSTETLLDPLQPDRTSQSTALDWRCVVLNVLICISPVAHIQLINRHYQKKMFLFVTYIIHDSQLALHYYKHNDMYKDSLGNLGLFRTLFCSSSVRNKSDRPTRANETELMGGHKIEALRSLEVTEWWKSY